MSKNRPYRQKGARTQANHASGASLLLTLVVIAGILILFTILARLVMVERRVSRGYSELQRADMAAAAGTADANNLLLYLFANFPDSATFWDPKVADTATPGTVFMFRDKAANDSTISYNSDGYASNVTVYARPLMSGALTKGYYTASGLTGEYKDTLPKDATTDKTRSVDLNEKKRFGGGDEKGWIGAMPGKDAVPIRVPWVEILEDPAAAKSDTNRAVSRYAFWIEDESFKLNVNTAKAALRGLPTAETKPFNGGNEGNPQASLRGVFAQDVAEGIQTARDNLKATGGQFLSPAQVGHSATAPSDTTALNFARDYKYLLTASSSGLNLSRSGAKRLNLNMVVERVTNAHGNNLSGAASDVQRAVWQIAGAIENQTPNFGQRFYRLNSSDILIPTSTAAAATSKNKIDVASTATSSQEAHTKLYVRKVAVNIYDALSPAVNPTVLTNRGQVLLGRPVYSLVDDNALEFDTRLLPPPTPETNQIEAIGKKPQLYFTEYKLNLRVTDAKPSERGVRDYEFEVDHYFEFWNLSNKTVSAANGDLGPSPYLVVEMQPGAAANDDDKKLGEDIPEGRPFKIKLDALPDVPAGGCIVITTDPNYSANAGTALALSGQPVYVAPALYAPDDSDQRCDLGISAQPYPAYDAEGSHSVVMANVRRYKITGFRTGKDEGEIQYGPRMEGSGSTKIILGNAYGILDAHLSLLMQKVTPTNMIVFQGPTATVRGSYVGGSRKGYYDPRGNLEGIDFKWEKEATDSLASSLQPNSMDKTTQILPGLGIIPSINRNTMFNTDVVPSAPTAANPVAGWPSHPMRGIGELGLIFDPIRYGSASATDIKTFRSGGQTLPIGQPDPAWDGTRVASVASLSDELKYQLSRSREWTAWRLADIFTVKRDEDMRGDATHPENRTEVAGLYNPNGILRDEGRVLRALLEGIGFGDANTSDPALAGGTLLTTDTEKLLPEASRTNITSATAGTGGKALANFIAQRLTRSVTKKFSPLWEPGELSQLDFFAYKSGSYTATGGGGSSVQYILSGKNNDALNDRGREEVFRRLADLMTAKGNTFTIYVVGQSLDKLGKPTATKAQRVTVRLRPVFNDALEQDFNPVGGTAERFRKPDSYTLHIIGVEEA